MTEVILASDYLHQTAAMMRASNQNDFLDAVADWLDATAREFEAIPVHLAAFDRHELDGRRTAGIKVAKLYRALHGSG
jgi:hypothetical protein